MPAPAETLCEAVEFDRSFDVLSQTFSLPTVNDKCNSEVSSDYSDFDFSLDENSTLDAQAAQLSCPLYPSDIDQVVFDTYSSAGNASDMSVDSFDSSSDYMSVDSLDTDLDDLSTHSALDDDEYALSTECYNVDEHVRYSSYLGPKAKRTLTPITILICDTIGVKKSRRLLRVLFDSGSMKTLIHRDVLPEGASTKRLGSNRGVSTLAGKFHPKEMVYMRDIRLPEFDKNRCVDEQKALVFEGKCRYDIILGADFLEKVGIDIKYSSKEMSWFGLTVPLRNANELFQEDYNQMAEAMLVQDEDDYFGEDWLDSYAATTVMDSKYDGADPQEVAASQTHLTHEQRKSLADLLAKFPKLFDGKLRTYPHQKFHIDIDESVPTIHQRPYAVPHVNRDAFHKELLRLCEIGVLERISYPTSWGSGSFCTPKKDNRIRFIRPATYAI